MSYTDLVAYTLWAYLALDVSMTVGALALGQWAYFIAFCGFGLTTFGLIMESLEMAVKKKRKDETRDRGGKYNSDYWLTQDPTDLATMRDPAKSQRLRDLVDKEIIHQAWGCKLWTLERMGKITRDQRMAGDQYGAIVEHRDRDPEAKKAYREAVGLLRHGNVAIQRAVDELVLEELMPITEADVKRCRDGLERLVYFFGIRKNKPRTRY